MFEGDIGESLVEIDEFIFAFLRVRYASIDGFS
jgi:hypothetical protein